MQQAAGDHRALFWGKNRSLKINEPTKFVQGFGVTKFNNYRTDGAKTKNSLFPDADFFLMRAAEAYLTFGEADARMNGGLLLQRAQKPLTKCVHALLQVNSQASLLTKSLTNGHASSTLKVVVALISSVSIVSAETITTTGLGRVV